MDEERIDFACFPHRDFAVLPCVLVDQEMQGPVVDRGTPFLEPADGNDPRKELPHETHTGRLCEGHSQVGTSRCDPDLSRLVAGPEGTVVLDLRLLLEVLVPSGYEYLPLGTQE